MGVCFMVLCCDKLYIVIVIGNSEVLMMPGYKDDYFRYPGIVWIALVPAGLSLLTVATLKPEWIPYDTLGPVGTLTLYLVKNFPSVLTGTCITAWLLHVGEAVYANQLCEEKQLSDGAKLKWTIQTFLYGMFSLKHLVYYEPKRQ